MSARLIAVLAAAALLGPLAPATALAAPARASLPDLEDEVMCVECGTPLEVSQSPVADQERAFIRARIARGETKAQIKAELVDEYGQNVLAEPQGGGFDVANWLVPLVAAVLALGGVAVAARSWRARRAPEGAAETGAEDGPALDPHDARRIDAELAAFDR